MITFYEFINKLSLQFLKDRISFILVSIKRIFLKHEVITILNASEFKKYLCMISPKTDQKDDVHLWELIPEDIKELIDWKQESKDDNEYSRKIVVEKLDDFFKDKKYYIEQNDIYEGLLLNSHWMLYRGPRLISNLILILLLSICFVFLFPPLHSLIELTLWKNIVNILIAIISSILLVVIIEFRMSYINLWLKQNCTSDYIKQSLIRYEKRTNTIERAIIMITSMLIIFLATQSIDDEIVIFDLTDVESSSFQLEMVRIPSGSFTMGTDVEELKYIYKKYDPPFDEVEIEAPSHQVSVDTFYMAKYEVTNEQFEAFVKDNNYTTTAELLRKNQVNWEKLWNDEEQKLYFVPTPTWRDTKLKYPEFWNEYPVVNVSWQDANEFCKWLTSRIPDKYKDHYNCRLPTEVEWEYACRAGTTTRRWWGNDDDDSQAHLYANVRVNYHHQKIDVDPFLSISSSNKYNNFGLHNMLGNVWEWCHDWYQSNFYQVVKDNKITDNPINGTQPSGENRRVVRGGGWGSFPVQVRCAYRGKDEEEYFSNKIGFRPVMVLQQN